MKPIRVAILCDYLEEGWPSMDLTAEMTFLHLERHCADRIQATMICPTFRPRFGRIPRFGSSRFAFNLDRLVNRYREYRRELSRIHKRERFDVYHVIDHSYAQLVHHLPANRTVVTCHDLDTFRCVLEPEAESRPGWFKALTQRTLTGLQKAAAITCVSEATRSALIDRAVVLPERVQTVYPGTHPECTPDPDPQADAEVARILGPRTDDPGQIEILHVGSNIPRKRIDVLLATFAEIRQTWPRARLIKVGGALTPDQDRQARELNLIDSMNVVPFFDRQLLAAIYRRADLMLQPSAAEGFCLPVAEAIGCGTPVILSDIPVLREVTENLATYCSVGDVASWVSTSLAMLADPDRRKNWIDRSQYLRQKYRWEHHVSTLLKIYEHVAMQTRNESLGKE